MSQVLRRESSEWKVFYHHLRLRPLPSCADAYFASLATGEQTSSASVSENIRIAPSPLRHSLGIQQTHFFSPRQHFPFSAPQPKRNLLDRLSQKPSITQPILRPFVPNKRLPIVASFPKMEMPLDRFMARRLQRPLPTTLLKVLSNPLDDPMPVVLRPMLGDRLGEKKKNIFPHIVNFPMSVRKSSQRRNVAVRLLVNS